MIFILNRCWIQMRDELDFWLRVSLALLRVIPVFLFTALRERIGLELLSFTVKILPRGCAQREGLMRGIREQREYDRYEVWTRIAGERPLPFHRWAEQWSTMSAKFRQRLVV